MRDQHMLQAGGSPPQSLLKPVYILNLHEICSLICERAVNDGKIEEQAVFEAGGNRQGEKRERLPAPYLGFNILKLAVRP